MTAAEWRASFPYFQYGIAYGWSAEELIRARETRPMIREHLNNLSKDSLAQTEVFVRIVRERFVPTTEKVGGMNVGDKIIFDISCSGPRGSWEQGQEVMLSSDNFDLMESLIRGKLAHEASRPFC